MTQLSRQISKVNFSSGRSLYVAKGWPTLSPESKNTDRWRTDIVESIDRVKSARTFIEQKEALTDVVISSVARFPGIQEGEEPERLQVVMNGLDMRFRLKQEKLDLYLLSLGRNTIHYANWLDEPFATINVESSDRHIIPNSTDRLDPIAVRLGADALPRVCAYTDTLLPTLGIAQTSTCTA